MHGHEKYPHSTTKHFSSHQKIPTARSSLSSPWTAPVSLNCPLYQPGAQKKTISQQGRKRITEWHRIFSIIMQHLWPLRSAFQSFRQSNTLPHLSNPAPPHSSPITTRGEVTPVENKHQYIPQSSAPIQTTLQEVTPVG